MIQLDRIHALAEKMKDADIGALLIGPDTDLTYLTGLHPLSDERFKALVVLQDGRFFHICPELYQEETREALGAAADIFVWSDTDGFQGAVLTANQKYHLDRLTVGVNSAVRAVDLLTLRDLLRTVFVIGNGPLEEIRICKGPEERAMLRRAAQLADEVAVEIRPLIHAGAVERDISAGIDRLFAAKGAPELAFETIVASGPNSSRPHYNGNTRVLTDHDIVILDFGCRYHGYCSDTSRTYFVGEPTPEQRKVYGTVLQANLAGERAACAGATAGAVDRAARDVIVAARYGADFLNRTGHGIGMADHEAPYIKEGNPLVLADGMAFSVEPGIYLAGRFGMRIEDIVLIENGRPAVLNTSPKELTVL